MKLRDFILVCLLLILPISILYVADKRHVIERKQEKAVFFREHAFEIIADRHNGHERALILSCVDCEEGGRQVLKVRFCESRYSTFVPGDRLTFGLKVNVGWGGELNYLACHLEPKLL